MVPNVRLHLHRWLFDGRTWPSPMQERANSIGLSTESPQQNERNALPIHPKSLVSSRSTLPAPRLWRLHMRRFRCQRLTHGQRAHGAGFQEFGTRQFMASCRSLENDGSLQVSDEQPPNPPGLLFLFVCSLSGQQGPSSAYPTLLPLTEKIKQKPTEPWPFGTPDRARNFRTERHFFALKSNGYKILMLF
jgi:hypothetical protein